MVNKYYHWWTDIPDFGDTLLMVSRKKIGGLMDGIGGRLALTRQALGLTQTEFARRAGVAQNTYNQVERGRKLPSVELSLMLCEAHDLTLDWIYRDDPSNLRYETADAIIALKAARSRNSA